MKKLNEFKDDKKILKSDLLKHVIGGLSEAAGCGTCDTCKYNDTVYVKVMKPPKLSNEL